MPAPQSQPDETPAIWLVYDGDCPFCSASTYMVRIKQAVGQLHILNAREAADHPLMAEIAAQRLDLNQGIVVKFQNRLYHGREALHVLALISSEKGWLNRLNIALFRHRRTVDLAYPLMKGVRDLTLKALGRAPI
ncbi:MAG TPA: DCC1-like thiol-disulfide oxidoreductase family protein [Asticcacaulis sp.]|nr:DCC1-like thiol-disulfide oxidoreductase family protein [Asticcacaulis sp.]